MKTIFNLISRSSDYNISQLDSSSKRCMCRKGFRLLDPDINKEQFRCIRNVDPSLNQDHMLSSEIVHPSASPQNFKVQVLQGELLVTKYETDISKEILISVTLRLNVLNSLQNQCAVLERRIVWEYLIQNVIMEYEIQRGKIPSDIVNV